MYCKNCGAELNDRYLVCVLCRKGKGFGNQYCAFCGEKLPEAGAAKCEACGHLTGPEDPKKPITPDKMRFSPVLAAIISAIAPGLAQAMNSQFVKGIAIFCGYLLLNAFGSGTLRGLLFQGAYALLAAADAFLGAKKLKDGVSMGRFEFF